MKNKFLILLPILPIIAVFIFVIFSINLNNAKINAVKSSDELVLKILESNKNKDEDILKFFHCRPVLKHQYQSDFNHYLYKYIQSSKNFDWSDANFKQVDNENYVIYNIKVLEKNQTVTDNIKITKQKPSLLELKTTESYCFLVDPNSDMFNFAK